MLRLTLDLAQHQKISDPLGGYPAAISKGIAAGLKDFSDIIIDTLVYPAFDTTMICAHLSQLAHGNLTAIERSIRNHPKLYTDLMHRMESRTESADVIYALPSFAYDAGIILAKQTVSHPDFLELNAIVEKNPGLYQTSLSRMQERLQPIEGSFEQFMQSSGPEKAAILAELSTVLLGPGIALKGINTVSSIVKTYRTTGTLHLRVARFHPLVVNDIFNTPYDFTLLNVADIRAIRGHQTFIWVYDKNKQLKITSRVPDVFQAGNEINGVFFHHLDPFIKHHIVANAEWLYPSLVFPSESAVLSGEIASYGRSAFDQLTKEGWVYSAGQITTLDGQLACLSLLTGHYKVQDMPFSAPLGRWAEKIFYENGFTEARGKYISIHKLHRSEAHPPKVSYENLIQQPVKIAASLSGATVIRAATQIAAPPPHPIPSSFFPYAKPIDHIRETTRFQPAPFTLQNSVPKTMQFFKPLQRGSQAIEKINTHFQQTSELMESRTATRRV